jgi:hypothetical protein
MELRDRRLRVPPKVFGVRDFSLQHSAVPFSHRRKETFRLSVHMHEMSTNVPRNAAACSLHCAIR